MDCYTFTKYHKMLRSNSYTATSLHRQQRQDIAVTISCIIILITNPSHLLKRSTSLKLHNYFMLRNLPEQPPHTFNPTATLKVKRLPSLIILSHKKSHTHSMHIYPSCKHINPFITSALNVKHRQTHIIIRIYSCTLLCFDNSIAYSVRADALRA